MRPRSPSAIPLSDPLLRGSRRARRSEPQPSPRYGGAAALAVPAWESSAGPPAAGRHCGRCRASAVSAAGFSAASSAIHRPPVSSWGRGYRRPEACGWLRAASGRRRVRCPSGGVPDPGGSPALKASDFSRSAATVTRSPAIWARKLASGTSAAALSSLAFPCPSLAIDHLDATGPPKDGDKFGAKRRILRACAVILCPARGKMPKPLQARALLALLSPSKGVGGKAPSRYAEHHPSPRRLAKSFKAVVIPALSRDPLQAA